MCRMLHSNNEPLWLNDSKSLLTTMYDMDRKHYGVRFFTHSHAHCMTSLKYWHRWVKNAFSRMAFKINTLLRAVSPLSSPYSLNEEYSTAMMSSNRNMNIQIVAQNWSRCSVTPMPKHALGSERCTRTYALTPGADTPHSVLTTSESEQWPQTM